MSVAQARSTLNALQETLPQRPPGSTLRADIVPLADQVAGRVRTGVTLMWAALLVACEVGVSTMCLIAGGLLVHSFWKLLQVDGGFAANRVLIIDVSLTRTRSMLLTPGGTTLCQYERYTVGEGGRSKLTP
jgi:hypothetical protein